MSVTLSWVHSGEKAAAVVVGTAMTGVGLEEDGTRIRCILVDDKRLALRVLRRLGVESVGALRLRGVADVNLLLDDCRAVVDTGCEVDGAGDISRVGAV